MQISRRTRGKVKDAIKFNFRAVNELQEKEIHRTDDTPKYLYTSNDRGNYRELSEGILVVISLIGSVETFSNMLYVMLIKSE